MKKILYIAAATLALTACSNDDNYIEEPIEAQILATIGGSAVSRASGTSWTAGDTIGITMADRYANLKYTTVSGDGNFTGTVMYFKNKREPVNLTAYYPFTGTEGTATPLIESNTLSENQTSANQPKIDFLYAVKENVSGTDPKISITFSHKMSKLSLIFNNGAGAKDVKITSYKIDGLIMQGTFNTVKGECTATNVAAEPLEIAVSGETDGVELPSLILFPQAVDNKKVTLTITDSDGQYYACDLAFSENVIASGNNYMFTITVNKTGLNVHQSSISDWIPNASSGNASSVVDPNN